MIIAVPKEIKPYEYRVAMIPEGVIRLTKAGHKVLVEQSAGVGSGFSDVDYQAAGGEIITSANALFAKANMVVKVKEPQPSECKLLKPKQVLFTYLHLAANIKIAHLLIKSKATCIAYETITDNSGNLPLLQTMSAIAGKIAIQSGMYALYKTAGGSGILLGGISGVKPATTLILGGGTVGMSAAEMALKIGSQVNLLDKKLSTKITAMTAKYPKLTAAIINPELLRNHLKTADLVIGAVAIAGAEAPKLITRPMLKIMRPGSALVDVAIDQGGCFETSRPTTHRKPTFIVDGIVHYCITNMPSVVASSATLALSKKTIDFILEIANKGIDKALQTNPHLRNGVHIVNGKIIHPEVAKTISKAQLRYQ